MKYNITATLGPASSDESVWKAMLSSGVTAFRLNTSHLSIQQLEDWIERYQRFLFSLDPIPSLILDLQGSKWRLGDFLSTDLLEGQTIELIYGDNSNLPETLPVPHPDFFKAAFNSNGEIILNDAKIQLKMETNQLDSLKARVIRGGRISSHKGITFTTCDYRKESLSEKDQSIFKLTHNLNFIQYAISYIKDAVEMSRYRAFFNSSTYLIAKLERQPAINEAIEIASNVNEIWVCRGDMGAELGIKAMAETVHDFSDSLDQFSIPVFLAGQVLEHMVEQASPTRSEICYLYEALLKGYAGIVLSDEAAIGKYPVESCRTAALFKN
jgi:pyruvate kinase